MESTYHKSVLLDESIEALKLQHEGIYVDLTFGGGGHSKAILSQLGETGKLYCFDQDEYALKNKIEDPRCILIRENFENAADYLMAIGVEQVDGVLADLGVSSFQFDHDASGFSFRDGIDLDMRMDKRSVLTAKDILNNYSQEQLQKIFQEYGEVRNSKTLANRIIAFRMISKFEKSNDLNQILDAIKFGHFTSYAAPVYQALRMEVNKESDVLKNMLQSIVPIIKPQGRLAIITFHSLEDRIVKNFMKYGDFENTPEADDLFGKKKKLDWKIVHKKPIEPQKEEIKRNSRSRSAKLRVIEIN
jgi:16S rRNA (cytosine1402-N4)-methyltransferase